MASAAPASFPYRLLSFSGAWERRKGQWSPCHAHTPSYADSRLVEQALPSLLAWGQGVLGWVLMVGGSAPPPSMPSSWQSRQAHSSQPWLLAPAVSSSWAVGETGGEWSPCHPVPPLRQHSWGRAHQAEGSDPHFCLTPLMELQAMAPDCSCPPGRELGMGREWSSLPCRPCKLCWLRASPFW